MLPLCSDCAQRKHTSCNVSFYKAHKSMQAYPCGIVMHVLATCFRSAPIVLNANTLCVTFHLFYRTIYASIKCEIVMHVLRRASVELRLCSTQTHFV